MAESKTINKIVDIIIPVFNVEKYLEKCVNSVINQTYKNINIMLIDDGSTDSSGKLCDALIKTDNRISVYHKSNGGLFDARNYGLDRSTGDFIFFLDSDDSLAPTAIEELINNQNETEADVVFCGYVFTGESNSRVFKVIPPKKIICGEEKFSILYEVFIVASWGKLFKKELIQDIKFKPYRRAEDVFFYYDFAKKAKSISLLDRALVMYLSRSDSISNHAEIKERLYDTDAFIYVVNNLKQDKCSRLLIKKYQYLLIKRYLEAYYEAYDTNKYHETKKLFRQYDLKLLKILYLKFKLIVLFKVFSLGRNPSQSLKRRHLFKKIFRF